MGDIWTTVRLRDLCDSVDYGLTASAAETPIGPRFVRITDIVQGSIDWSSVPYVSVSDPERQKYRLHSGDIVVARTGASTGHSVCILDPPEALFASYLVRFAVAKDYDPRFVGYALKGRQWWDYIHGVLGDKSAQPNASATTLGEARLSMPSLDTQRAISRVLGALDDKIELNRRITESLEELLRALYLQRQSGLGAEVGRVADLVMDRAAADSIEPAEPYVAMEHLRSGGLIADTYVRAASVASQKSRFRAGDVLVGKLRPYFRKAGVVDRSGVCSTEILVLRPHEGHVLTLLGAIGSRGFFDRLTSHSEGTRMPRASASDVLKAAVKLPSPGGGEGDEVTALKLIALGAENVRESAVLADLRDTLLPELISGRLRVNDAEKAVEAAV